LHRVRGGRPADGRRAAHHVGRPPPAGTAGRLRGRGGGGVRDQPALPGAPLLRAARPKGGGMRGLRVVGVLLLILVALLVVADRAAAWAAERTVADKVASELADNGIDSAPPEVSIGGIPFLTQVGAGRFEEITLVLRDVG